MVAFLETVSKASTAFGWEDTKKLFYYYFFAEGTVAFRSKWTTKMGSFFKEQSDVKTGMLGKKTEKSFGNRFKISLSQQKHSGDHCEMKFPIQCQEVRFPHCNNKYLQL